MKRLAIFLGAGALLLSIVTPLYAQMDIKTTGLVRVRYRDWNEFLMDSSLPVQGQPGAQAAQTARNRHYFDTTIRMGVVANIEPGLKGVIEIERYDDFGSHSTFNAGPSPTAATAAGIPAANNTPGSTGTDSIYFRQAWVDWVIPGTPIHIAGGRQLPTIGGSIVFTGAVYGTDGLQIYSALGPGTLTGFYWKPQNDGNRRWGDGDFDIYGGSYKFEWMARNTVELYGLVTNDKVRTVGQSAYACPGVVVNGDCRQSEEFYAGASFFGVQGPFTYRLEGAYQGGTARKGVAATAGAAATGTIGNAAGDIDRSAGMIVGGVSYALVPELALNLDGGWASGDDDPTDDTHTNFNGIYGLFQPTLLFAEGNPYGNTASAQFGQNVTNRAIFGTTMGTADLDLVAMLDDNQARFSPGMFYLKPGVKWVPLKQVTVNGDVALLWAAVSPGGVDSYIGTELDIKVGWQVYKNLVVNGYFAYMFAGGYFDTGGALGATQVGVNDNDVSDPWFGRVEMILSF